MTNYNEILKNIRMIVATTVHNAKSGHSGMGMGAAGIGMAVWENMIYDYENPDWNLRDRLVFSAGHGIVLYYSLLYIEGVIDKEDLRTFRRNGSQLTGLGEYKSLPYIESTTGSLGQGLANSVGMAYALKNEKEKKHKEFVYCIVGDGCLQEGISYESTSFAGVNKLDNLIVLYDSNNVSIDGKVSITFNENIKSRFEAMGWDYHLVEDGDDINKISDCIKEAKKTSKPVIIEVKTEIANGSKMKGNHLTHGSPLEDNIIKQMDMYENGEFYISEDTINHFKSVRDVKKRRIEEIDSITKRVINIDYKKTDDLYEEIDNDNTIIEKSSQLMNKLFDDNFYVGSADLARSTKCILKENQRRNIYFGVRENAMSSISNGIYLATKEKTIVSTYFVFSDIMKNSIRMSAIMKIPNIYVFTHDGFSLGIDGVTHIPIEHLHSLRSLPNLNVYRPGTNQELIEVWIEALNSKDSPSAIILSRENININNKIDNFNIYGYYVKYVPDFDITIVCTGSEINNSIKVSERLKELNIKANVYSIPCVSEKDISEQDIREICTKEIIINEIGNDDVWYKIFGNKIHCNSLENYINSGSPEELKSKYGYSEESIILLSRGLVK